MSTEANPMFGEQRFAEYDGQYPDAYKRGYSERGRFGNVGNPAWSPAERAAYVQGGRDAYADSRPA